MKKFLFAGFCVLALAACDKRPEVAPTAGELDPYGAAGNGTGTGTGAAGDPTSVAYFNQTIGNTVLFEVDQANLTSDAMALLSQQAQWLASNSQHAVVIEGHADEQGTREYNLALGARRASAVQSYLVGQGVSSSRIRTVTFGKERPLAVCSTEACWSKNRRAVTIVSGGLGS